MRVKLSDCKTVSFKVSDCQSQSKYARLSESSVRVCVCVHIQVFRPLGNTLSIMGICNIRSIRDIRDSRDIRNIRVTRGIRDIRVIIDFRNIRVIGILGILE